MFRVLVDLKWATRPNGQAVPGTPSVGGERVRRTLMGGDPGRGDPRGNDKVGILKRLKVSVPKGREREPIRDSKGVCRILGGEKSRKESGKESLRATDGRGRWDRPRRGESRRTSGMCEGSN